MDDEKELDELLASMAKNTEELLESLEPTPKSELQKQVESKGSKATPEDIAQWMLEEVRIKTRIYQNRVVYDIRRIFGEKFVYWNKNKNLAISPVILQEFRKVSQDTVVWEKGQRCWRKRRPSDPKGQRQTRY